MVRAVPMWLFLACMLSGIVLLIIFGWGVKSTMNGEVRSDRLRKIGNTAVNIASYPDVVRYSLMHVAADDDESARVPSTGADLATFKPIRMKSGIHVQGLMVRVDEDALAREAAWRIVVGTFLVEGEMNHAALLLSSRLEIVKMWVLREDEDLNPRPTGQKIIHGFVVLRDGSVIFTFNAGVSMQRVDWCGRRIWSTPGAFDHTMALDDDEESIWTMRNEYFAARADIIKIATKNGGVIRRFSLADIIEANPMIDIFGVRGRDVLWDNDNPRNISLGWTLDPFHLNDVEPLPAAFAGRFHEFSAGDLLLSVRSSNLVLVIDPQTLKVKWWESGAWRRQHDPDWQPNGEITVYDNRMGRDYSRIVSIDPASRRGRVVFDGRANDFYSVFRGNHQVTETGGVLIVSPQQGRVFEIDRNGNVVFDMLNTRAGGGGYVVSDAVRFPPERLIFEGDAPCAN